MIFGKNRAFLYPTKVLADTNIKQTYLLTCQLVNPLTQNSANG